MRLLASLKQCTILTKGIFFSPSLQSATITLELFALLLLLLMRSATTFAFNSISTADRLREIHRQILTLKAHNLAATLVVTCIARAYPFTDLPKLSQMIPPPAKLGLPTDEPPEFNLYQLRGGEPLHLDSNAAWRLLLINAQASHFHYFC